MTLALEREQGPASIERLLDTAFVHRQAPVHQAAGMVSVQLEVSIADGMARLRAYAFAQDRGLGQVADDVVLRRLRFRPATDPVYTSKDGTGGGPVRTADDLTDDTAAGMDESADESSPDAGG